jgi:hypothetical protein
MGARIGGLCIDCSLVRTVYKPRNPKGFGVFCFYLSVVQPGRMPALGAGGREFDPLHSDQKVVDKVLMFL